MDGWLTGWLAGWLDGKTVVWLVGWFERNSNQEKPKKKKKTIVSKRPKWCDFEVVNNSLFITLLLQLCLD